MTTLKEMLDAASRDNTDIVNTQEADALVRGEARMRAITSCRLHMARLLEGAEILRQLEHSLMAPDEERSPDQAMREVMLVVQLKMLDV